MKVYFIIFCLFVSLQLQAITHFISPSGSDTNPGSAILPWKTLSYACSHSVSGDIIYVNPGIYYESASSFLPSGVHIEGAGITSHLVTPEIILQGSGGNQHISGLMMDGNSVEGLNAILIDGRSNVIINNCVFINFKTGAEYYASEQYEYVIEVRNSTDIEIHHNIIEGGLRGFYNKKSLNIHHNTIGKNNMAFKPEAGIYLCDVVDLKIWNNLFKNLAIQIEISSYGVTSLRNVYIYNNVMMDIGVTSGDTYGSGIRFSGLTSTPARNINIVNNTMVANPGQRSTMIGVWLPTVGNAKDIHIENNIIQGFKYASIFAAGARSTDSLIANDPQYSHIERTPFIFDSVFIENNILYQNAITGHTYAPNNLPYFTNIIMPTYIVEANLIVSDPKFTSTSNFKLLEDSPGVGAGIIHEWITTDFEDYTIFMPPNIGAYGGTITTEIIEDYTDKLLIYPNPATTYLNVIFDDPSYKPERFKVYDFSGRLVIDKKVEEQHDFTYMPIKLSSGIYILAISDKINRIVTSKFIVK